MSEAKKTVLPALVVTCVAEPDDPQATRVELPEGMTYFIKPIQDAETRKRVDGEPSWMRGRFNLYPLVRDAVGVPWAEANVFILAKLEEAMKLRMSTFSGAADGLRTFRTFLDEKGIDWTVFPAHKLLRPTYRFNGHLRHAIEAGKCADTTARRWMSAVVAFYKWCDEEGVFHPAHEPWKETDRFVEMKDAKGFSFAKKVKTTDVAIKVVKQDDPYTGYIEDGGKLKPLNEDQQMWVLEALVTEGNTEMTLIHLLALFTGARIQTVLTFCVRHAQLEIDDDMEGELRFPVGPGTGVDTKWDKQMTLHIPVWLYRQLQTYSFSERAIGRRRKARGGDTEDQYLFLSERGAPLYRSKADVDVFDPDLDVHHEKQGQALRQFITDRVLPFVNSRHAGSFHYQFHDLRASYGMNLTDHQQTLVARGEVTSHQAREFVRVRMGHSSAAVTDRYLNYRSNLHLARMAGQGYDERLKALAQKALKGGPQ